jgi:hypothetical protein
MRTSAANDLARATIGRNAAIADFGWWRTGGFVAWLLWGIVHIYELLQQPLLEAVRSVQPEPLQMGKLVACRRPFTHGRPQRPHVRKERRFLRQPLYHLCQVGLHRPRTFSKP